MNSSDFSDRVGGGKSFLALAPEQRLLTETLGQYSSSTLYGPTLTTDASNTYAVFRTSGSSRTVKFIDTDTHNIFNQTGELKGVVVGGSVVLANGNIATAFSTTESYVDNSMGGIALVVTNQEGANIAGPLRVNTETSNYQNNPSITLLPEDQVLITWDSYHGDGDRWYGVYGQILDANGNKIGGEIHINQTIEGDQRGAKSDALDTGEVLIAWTSNHLQYLASKPGAGSNDNFRPDSVMFRILDANSGIWLTEEIDLAVPLQEEFGLSDTYYDPIVSAMPDGNFVVSWLVKDAEFSSGSYDYVSFSGPSQIGFQKIAVDGTLIDSTSYLSVPNMAVNYDVEVLADGALAVIWEDKTQFNEIGANGVAKNYELYMQLLGPDLVPLGEPVDISQERGRVQTPDIVTVDQDSLVVGWSGYDRESGTNDNWISSRNIEVEYRPNISNQLFTIDQNETLTTQISASDLNPNDLLTFSSTDIPDWLSLGTDGSLSAIPANEHVGTHSFTARVHDNSGLSAASLVSITVNDVNDSPVALNKSINVQEDFGAYTDANGSTSYPSPYNSSLIIDITGRDGSTGAGNIDLNAVSDVDGDRLTVTNATTDSGGVVKLGPLSAGTFVDTLNYRPAQDFSGTETITYTVSDGKGGADTAEISVNVTSVNDFPQFVPVVGDVLGVLVSADGEVASQVKLAQDDDTVTYTLENDVSAGLLNLQSDGSFTFDSNDEFQSLSHNQQYDLNFDYAAIDSFGAKSVTQSWQVGVVGVNDAPTLSNPGDQLVWSGDSFSLDIVALMSDVDTWDSHQYSITGLPAGISFNYGTGLLSGSLTDAMLGTHPISIEVTDNWGASDTISLDVVIRSHDPVINDFSYLTGKAPSVSGFARPGAEVELLFGRASNAEILSVKVLADSVSGAFIYSLDSDDMILLGQGPGATLTAKTSDITGTETLESDTASFGLYSTTNVAADGSVQLSQLSHVGVGGTTLTGDAGSLSGSDSINLSNIAADFILDNKLGVVGKLLDGSGNVGAGFDFGTGSFETAVLGGGDDLIVGPINSVDPGLGSNAIDSVSNVDYSSYVIDNANPQSALHQTLDAASGSQNFDLSQVQTGDIVSISKNGYALEAVFDSVDGLIASFTSQLSRGLPGFDTLSLSTGQTANTILLSHDGFEVSQSRADGIYVDLTNSSRSINAEFEYFNWLASNAVKSDGTVDDLRSVDDISKGTQYSDVILGASFTEAGSGNDYVKAAETDPSGGFPGFTVLDGGAGDDMLLGAEYSHDVLMGNSGNDVLIGGAGDDTLFGETDTDVLTGGAGADHFVFHNQYDSGTDLITDIDTVTDYEVGSILSSAAGRQGNIDTLWFQVSTPDLPGYDFETSDIRLSLAVDKSTGQDNAPIYRISVHAAVYGTDGKLAYEPASPIDVVDLDWESVSQIFGTLNPDDYDLNVYLQNGSAISNYEIEPFYRNTPSGFQEDGQAVAFKVGVELKRVSQLDDTADESYLVGEGVEDDVIVLNTQDSEDVIIGSAGDDITEVRIQGVRGQTPITNQADLICDLGNITDIDALLIEGARNLGDISFARTTYRGETSGSSLKIDYEQYRGLDDASPESGYSAGDLHATGEVTIFNQFSISQSDLFKQEKLILAEENFNPLDAAVKTYFFGEIVDQVSAATGSSLSDGSKLQAIDGEDSILIGQHGSVDEYHLNWEAHDGKEVWVYGMANGSGSSAVDSLDQVVINNSLGLDSSAITWTQTDVSDGEGTVNLTTATVSNGSSVVEIIFADQGNIATTDLSDKIKFES